MSDLASQAFDDLFTHPHGNSYFVSVEPVFDEQVSFFFSFLLFFCFSLVFWYK